MSRHFLLTNSRSSESWAMAVGLVLVSISSAGCLGEPEPKASNNSPEPRALATIYAYSGDTGTVVCPSGVPPTCAYLIRQGQSETDHVEPVEDWMQKGEVQVIWDASGTQPTDLTIVLTASNSTSGRDIKLASSTGSSPLRASWSMEGGQDSLRIQIHPGSLTPAPFTNVIATSVSFEVVVKLSGFR